MEKKLVIKTTLDNNDFNKKYQELEKQLSYAIKEQEKINSHTGNYKDKLLINIEKQKELSDKIEETSQKIEQMNSIKARDGMLTSKEQQELDKLNSQYSKLLSKNETLSYQYDDLNLKIDNQSVKYQKSVDKIQKINDGIKKLQDESDKIDLDGFQNSLSTIGSHLMSTIKKVGKWTMAIFGVRTALSLVSRATSIVSQYNDSLAQKIESIKYTLSMALEPVVTRIVDWVYKLLQYVNYISQAWFGVNLFANATAKSTAKAAKSAKDMKKSLQGYDTAQVLQKNDTTSGDSGSGSASAMPSLSDTDVPDWIKWIAEHKDTVLDFLKQAAILLGAIKIAEFLNKLGLLNPLFTLVSKGATLFLNALKGMSGLQTVAFIGGIALAIAGLIETISAVVNFIKDPSWENFNVILEGLIVTLTGLGIAMIAFNATNPIGWIILAVDAIIAIIAVIGKLTFELFKDRTEILSTKEAQENLEEAIENTKKATDDYVSSLDAYDDAVKKAKEATKALEEAEKKNGLSGEELFKQVKDGTLKYETMTDAQKEVYKAYMKNEQAQLNLKKATEDLSTGVENLTKAKEEEKKASWESQLATAKESGKYDKLKKSIVDAVERGELSAKEARDYIERASGDMSDDFKKTFTKDLPDNIKTGLDPNKYDSVFNKFKRKINEVWDGVKSGAKSAFDKVKSWFGFSSGGLVTNGNVVGFKKGGFVNQGKVIKLASGSIINNPGHGVPVTRAIAGEAGAEGILPLTDEQAMAELGKQIGRWVTTNINLTNYLDSRIIARIMKKVNAENSFARNGV